MLGPCSLAPASAVRALELRVHRHDDGLCLLEHIADTRLNDQPKATKTGKKPAAAPFASKAGKTQKNPLFESRPKNFGIGACLCDSIASGC